MTPTPWKTGLSHDGFVTVTTGSSTICTVGCADLFDGVEADAAYIVKAVNSHASIVKALQEILTMKPLATATVTDLWLNRGEIESIARAALEQATKEN